MALGMADLALLNLILAPRLAAEQAAAALLRAPSEPHAKPSEPRASAGAQEPRALASLARARAKEASARGSCAPADARGSEGFACGSDGARSRAAAACSAARRGARMRFNRARSAMPSATKTPDAKRADIARDPPRRALSAEGRDHKIFTSSETRLRTSRNTSPSLASGVVRTMSSASCPTAWRMT